MSEVEQGTAVEQPVAPATPGGEGSAPSQNESGEAGNVETPQESRQPERGIPSGAYRELKGLRQRVREYERRFAELESRMPQSKPAADDQGANPKTIWDDPDSFVEAKFKAFQERQQVVQGRQDAYKFIQSQDDVRTEEDEDEIAEIMTEFGLDAALNKNPKAAAELGLRLWREKRGINPAADSAKQLQLTKDQAKAVVGAPAAGGKKIWTEAEIAELSKKPEKWGEVREEVMSAMKEGRIR